MRPVVPHELRQFAREQRRQRDDADHIEKQDPRLQAAELAGVLHTLRQEQERAHANACP